MTTPRPLLDPRRWERAVEIFERALTVGPAEHESFVLEETKGDPELTSIVLGMIGGDAREDVLLDEGIEAVAGLANEVIEAHGAGPAPGDHVGKFEIIGELGRGGMGVVYAARDRSLGRTAALKFLPPRTTGKPEQIERLVAEARAASALDHPNIATVYQIGRASTGQRFIAMALYEGETLRERLRRGPLRRKEALSIATQVARGLAAAHEAGIVHRDVKPANIFLTRQGLVKLLDFGIAAMLGTPSEARAHGTALYMSPQQASGEPPAPSDDVWSLGVVLYEMLMGVRPLTPNTPSQPLRRATDSHPAARLGAAVRHRAQLERVMNRALDKRAAARFPDGGALLRALERCGRASRAVVIGRAALAASLVIAAIGLTAALRRAEIATPVLAVGLIESDPGGGRPDLMQVVPDLLADRLAQVPTLQVISTQRLHEVRAQLANGNDRFPFSEAAQHAGASELLEGTLRDGTDGRLRLELRRLDLKTGALKSALAVEGVDPFELVDQAVRRLSRTLGLMSTAAAGSFPTRSLVAYRFYEEGLRAYYQGDALGAHRLFEAAFLEDTTFAMALHYDRLARSWAGLLPVEADTMLGRLAQLAEGRPERERLLIRAVWADVTGQPNRLALAESLATRYPREPDGHHLLGRAKRSHEGNFNGAIPHFRRVLAMDSLSVRGGPVRCMACDALGEMISAYHLADSLPAAERVAREWVRLQPSAARAWVYLATILERQNRLEEALAARAAAAPLQPGNRTDPVYPGLIAMRAGDWNAADALFSQRMRDGPPLVRDEAGWFLVVSLRERGRFREALAVARSISNRLAEATVLLELGRAREAAFVFDSLAANTMVQTTMATSTPRRRSPWLLTHKATALAAAGDTGALPPLARAIEAASRESAGARNQRLTHYVGGLHHSARGEHAEAAAAYRRAIYSLTNGYSRLNLALARELLALGRPREAIAVLQPVLRGPFDAGNFYLPRTEINLELAHAFDASGQRDSAIVHYQRVLSAWASADPELHVRRDTIRLRLASLRGERVARR